MAHEDVRADASDADQLPLRIERERLPDGRAITYYSRPGAQPEPTASAEAPQP